MKKEQLYTLFGGIDDELVEQAEAYKPPARRKWAGRRLPAAACLALAAGTALFLPRLLEPAAPPFQGATYSSLEDIPVERSGNNWLDGPGGGPVHLWESGGNLYFSYTTRWVGDDEKQETVTYETVFRVNTEDNSYTAVSEEARAIALRDGRFIYIRSDEYLTAENLWTVPYYTNSLEWNDERKISAEKAMKLMDGTRRTGFMDGRVSYTVDVAGDTVRIEMENGGEYTVRIPFEQLSGLDKDSLGFGSIAALARDKLYFSAHYVSEGVYREDLFVVGLDGKGLRMLTHEAFTGMFGLDATLDESGNLWFLYRGETSAIMRLDTRNDQMKMVAQVDGAVWSFVKNATHILCLVNPTWPGELQLIPY